jgi:hypothetical protein
MKSILFNKKKLNLSLKIQKISIMDEEKKKKIKIERRKRFQVYTTLDYLLSMNSYFDFYSIDAFKIIYFSKYIAKLQSKENVDWKSILLSFATNINPNLKDYESYDLNFINVSKRRKVSDREDKIDKDLFFYFCIILKYSLNFSFSKFFEDINISLENFLDYIGLENDKNYNLINYNEDVLRIFDSAADNAINRFKTAVITPEILFITLMEEENMYLMEMEEDTIKPGTYLQRIITDETEFYLLRYKLLKKLHMQETFIKNDIKKNYFYFAYLLKTQLSEFEFTRLADYNSKSLGVVLFRNKLISQGLNRNLSEILKTDIYNSIKHTNTRRYSYKK